ncbi:hypothetical protein DL764_011056 [Monosporascus ibericus]|uniref:Phytochrome n=1 Tax=Monosporascus ibericus TaxID=155417 RepID=A0A4V1X8I8_9PEZI|nr:hypothetical protein DL764_011056 [Monosporascus ibericus]
MESGSDSPNHEYEHGLEPKPKLPFEPPDNPVQDQTLSWHPNSNAHSRPDLPPSQIVSPLLAGELDSVNKPPATPILSSNTPVANSTPPPLSTQGHSCSLGPNGSPASASASNAISTHLASSARQVGYEGGNNTNGSPSDRIFPVRSLVSLDKSRPMHVPTIHAPGKPSFFPPRVPAGDARHRQNNPRAKHDPAVRRADTVPVYASSALGSPEEGGSGMGSARRKNTQSGGPIGSVPAGIEPQASVGPLPFPPDTASDASDVTRENMSPRTGDSQAVDSAGRRTPSELNEALATVRFRHVMTDDGHAVITGRDGTLQRCEDEPIHTPGAVQSFGLLVALKEELDGHLSVHYVSENSTSIIGFSPRELFQLSSFTDILTEEQADNLLDHIDFIRDEETDPATNGPDVFNISVRPPKRRTIKFWCAMHVNPVHPDLVICEFELEDDQEHPLRPSGELSPVTPEDTLYQNPSMEELLESTEASSKPLRVLRSARKRQGEAGAMQVFDIMSQVQEQLASAPNLHRFLKILVSIVKELTGFHRVMIYQFDAAFNGKVVTELVDPAQTRDLYHGLHFPASDIPKQARELYKLNKVRLLYDRDLESARLVCRSAEDLERPLDLSHSYLRAMSPIHLKYLANMAVRSSMSISINAFNELWGLIACHSYGPRGMRVPFPIRKMCRLVGDTASRNIERLSYASRLQARKLINTVPTDKNPSGYIIASSEDLLKLFDADFGMLSIKDETKVLGRIERSQEALAMLEYLRMRSFTSVLNTQDIREDFPDLCYPPGFKDIAGLLYVPLSVGGDDFIVFFRKGLAKEVRWAGNPYQKTVRDGTSDYLEPRSSFKAWHESVIGQSREWSEEQVETAAVLCLVYGMRTNPNPLVPSCRVIGLLLHEANSLITGKFIEVWRQKEAALQGSHLTKLLLANSAHEVRTPLNAIINCLEIAMEGSLDQETRENLARSHSASKSLIYVINDLLDLTKTEEGQELVKDEILDLLACLREATDPFKVDAKRKGIAYEVTEHPGLPRYVHGDYRRVRQAVSNLTANALQHTAHGSVKVESYVSEVQQSRIRVEIVVQDTGCGMSSDKLDDLFQDLEQVGIDVDESKSVDEAEKPRESRTLGLGLAIVARIVRNMDGQLRLKSEEGKGSRFVIQLPFDLPTGNSLKDVEARDATALSNTNSSVASIAKVSGPTEKRSFDEADSIGSHKSKASRGSGRSSKSDADRLIDAIQTPLSVAAPAGNFAHLQRRGSRERHHNSSDHSTLLQRPDFSCSPTDSRCSGSSLRQANDAPRSGPGPVNTHNATEQPRVGAYSITNLNTPIKHEKVPDEPLKLPKSHHTGLSSGIFLEIPQNSEHEGQAASTPKSGKLRVLVAEDDPINFKILKKRLEKTGHEVSHALNGEDCASVYKEGPSRFDVILMDMQMPIVDGLSSTKIIRAFETSNQRGVLSSLAARHGRIPIFAVSASLVEQERPQYIEAGFDGWIVKPIDFRRLNVLLDGIFNDDKRDHCLYVPGEWERGGWFAQRST